MCKNERIPKIIYLEKGDYKSYNQSPDTNPSSPGKELNFITLRESIQSLNKQLNKTKHQNHIVCLKGTVKRTFNAKMLDFQRFV